MFCIPAVWLQNWLMSVIEWKQASVAGVKLRRFTGHVGGIEVGSVEFDGSNRLWTWSSPFAEDVWGHAPTRQARNRRWRLGYVGGLRSSVPCWMGHQSSEGGRIMLCSVPHPSI